MITDEQVLKIFETHQGLEGDEWRRAVFAECAKIALAGPTEKELAEIQGIPTPVFSIRAWARNRLRSLTEPPKDAAVEAVMAHKVRGYTMHNDDLNCFTVSQKEAEQLVAAVDKARGRA